MSKNKTSHKSRSGYRILLICTILIFAGFVGLILWTGYSSQLQVRNTARELFVGESAKRAMAVSFYYSKRVSELKRVAASKSVRSLLNVLKEGEGEIVQQAPAIAGDICSLLSRTLAKRSLGDELVFSRIAVLDKDGDLILDSDSECLLNADDYEFSKYRVRYGTPAFFAGEYGGELSIVVSVPIDVSQGIRGTVVGWTRVESLHRSLELMTVSPSVGTDFLRVGGAVVAVSDHSARQSGELLLMDVLHDWDGLTVLEAGKSGREVDYLAISSPVQGTSLSVISLVEEEQFFGFLSIRMQFALYLFIFILISVGCFWLIRGVLRNKIYEARMQEASRRIDEVNRQKDKVEQEIRNRHLADALRRRAEIKFRDIFDNAPMGIFQATLDGSYLTANKALAELYGYENSDELISEVSSVGDQVYMNSQDWQRCVQMLRFAGQVASYEVECQRKDGGTVWTSRDMRLVESEPGMSAYVEGFVIDVTARKKAEKEQQKSEWRFRSLFENSPVALWELDLSSVKEIFDSYGPDMLPVIREELLSDHKSVSRCVENIRIIDANNRTIEFFGTSSLEQLIDVGFSPYVTQHSWRIYRTVFLDLLKGAERHRSEFSFLRLDGREQFFILNLTIVPGCEDSWERVLVAVEDISELKRIEKELRSSREEAQEANEAKGRFLANMTHEFRTPMNAVKGMVQLLQRSELTSEQQENLRLIKSSVDSLLVIVNDILDYSKLDSVHMELNEENIDFPAFLREMGDVVDIGAMNKPLQVILEAENVPDCVRVDSLRLRQVLVNLLGNGVKFTDKGNVTLRCRPEGPEGEGGKLRLLFEVSDTGIGLPKDGAESLFESFVQADPSITRKYGGTGLGLAICYKLVKHLGGELSARNNEQGGALFSFVLPVEVCRNFNQPQEVADGSEEDFDSVDYSDLKVMVAEDSKMNRILLRKVFEKNGLKNYVMVENGKDAVDTFNESDDFDIIFMDIQMPVLDGFEAARAIRKTHSPVRIVALTANVGEDFLQKCFDSGMDSRITKPFNVDDLLAELAKVIKS
ncbi:PAS domain-containing hybrid sensor histidine kinase/response regulator [Maridesulfovibrio salexigens]|uniref:histidine kinase n=1 Tax=Maridesulfovibrio salexigens (strain ATCC 14822 / DSM 2638 / NCIMB 8403 / VKM B-1763) TaxID=526222 RepID=C6C1H1_MARSD|nr:PAS domain-containing sensor histidine kinase [Maridesulfovibrio salexigens]ACS81146.1 PAS/PAC sensor hybrid histidine kinase [Maridesulfovibrio salexigens DSM 2638]